MTTEPTDSRESTYASRLARSWSVRFDQDVVELVGTFAFVDVSGFTRMSERFARSSTTGAEDVNAVLNQIFGRLVEIVHAFGSDVIQFGGDALALWFEGEDHERRAACCMLDLQQDLRRQGSVDTPGGRVRLRMSAGIESGVVTFARVGSTHSDVLALGDVVSTVLRLENSAAGGTVAVGPSLRSALPDCCVAEVDRGSSEGWLLRRRPRLERLPTAPESSSCAVSGTRLLDPQLGAVVATDGFRGEHRGVAVAFVSIVGLGSPRSDSSRSLAAGAVGVVERLVAAIDSVVASHDVCWTACDVMVDGATFLLFTGAPRARGDDQERLLRACLSVLDQCAGSDVRIGVNTGPAFVGSIGAPARRTLAIIGDTVNLAARLKSLAGSGELIASRSVLDACRIRFEVDEREPVKVKGKSQPVAHARVLNARSRHRAYGGADLPFVGRGDLVEDLERRLRAGETVDLVAEAGTGKSRVVDAVDRLLRADPSIVVLRGAADPYESSVPLRPLVDAFRGAIEAGPDDPPDEVGRAAARWLARHDLDGLLPLVAPMFGLEESETAATAHIAPEHRSNRRREVIAELIQGLAPQVMVLVEDLHWADDTTRDLLEFIAHGVGSVGVLVSRRPGSLAFSDTPTSLPPLDATAMLELADAIRGDAPVPDHELSALVDQAAGSPLFLRELVFAAADGFATAGSTIESLVAARLDDLPSTTRLLIRDLAVLGTSADVDLLSQVVQGDDLDDPATWDAALDLVDVVIEAGRVTAVRFDHDIHRTIAYSGSSVARRREIHRRVAAALESRSTDDGQDIALLAMHHHRGANWGPALAWSRQAAERAQSVGAWSEARSLWRQAADAAGHLGIPPDEQAVIFSALGDAEERSGRFEEAERSYLAARRHLTAIGGRTVELDVRRAVVASRRGSFRRTILLASRALTDEVPPSVRVRGRLARALARAQQGRFEDAARELSTCLRLAEDTGDDDLTAQVLVELEMVASALDLPEAPDHARRAEALLERLGDELRLSYLMSNSAFTSFARGEWTEATRRLDRAVEALMRCGDTDGAGFASNNQAEILVEQGRYAEAEQRFLSAARLLRASRNGFGEPNINSGLGRLCVRTGRPEEGAALLRTARDQYLQLGVDAYVVDTDVRLAEALALDGRPDAALHLLDLVRDAVDATGDVLLALTARRHRVVVLGSLGRMEEAESVLADLESAALAQNSPFDELCCAEIRRVWNGAAELPPEMEALRRSMGIVSLPPVPSTAGR